MLCAFQQLGTMLHQLSIAHLCIARLSGFACAAELPFDSLYFPGYVRHFPMKLMRAVGIPVAELSQFKLDLIGSNPQLLTMLHELAEMRVRLACLDRRTVATRASQLRVNPPHLLLQFLERGAEPAPLGMVRMLFQLKLDFFGAVLELVAVLHQLSNMLVGLAGSQIELALHCGHLLADFAQLGLKPAGLVVLAVAEAFQLAFDPFGVLLKLACVRFLLSQFGFFHFQALPVFSIRVSILFLGLFTLASFELVALARSSWSRSRCSALSMSRSSAGRGWANEIVTVRQTATRPASSAQRRPVAGFERLPSRIRRILAAKCLRLGRIVGANAGCDCGTRSRSERA